ncbi:MAG: hypothetical protein WBM83_01485 [Flavobacteriaceae bacterium]
MNKSEADAVQDYALRAIELADEIDFKRGLAYGYKNLGHPLYLKGELNNELVEYWQQ